MSWNDAPEYTPQGGPPRWAVALLILFIAAPFILYWLFG